MTTGRQAISVLLIDDERELVNTMAERLHTRGMIARVAYGGEEGLQAIDEAPPHVVILDLKMPGMDGLDVLRVIKQRRPDIEVIMLTGHGTSLEETAAREQGVFAYFSKPQRISVLETHIRQASEKRRPSRDE